MLPSFLMDNRFRLIGLLGSMTLVPVILMMGFAYIDTVERVGAGEEVEPTAILDASRYGIKVGQTSAEVERVLGLRSIAVDSPTPGQTCRGYPLGNTPGQVVICYAQTAGPNGQMHWVVTSSRVDAQ